MEHAAIADLLKARCPPSLLGAVAGLCLSSAAWAEACTISHYSPVGEKDCKPLPSLEAGRTIVSGKGEYVFECPGAPAGYRLYLVESDPRSWYVVEHDGKRHSFEKEIVHDNPPGDFPNVGRGGQVEWLLEGGTVKGLIFRVSYQNKDATASFSRLLSAGLVGDAPLLLGQSSGNEAARQLLNHCPEQ